MFVFLRGQGWGFVVYVLLLKKEGIEKGASLKTLFSLIHINYKISSMFYFYFICRFGYQRTSSTSQSTICWMTKVIQTSQELLWWSTSVFGFYNWWHVLDFPLVSLSSKDPDPGLVPSIQCKKSKYISLT